MKKLIILSMLLCLALSGCGMSRQEAEQLFRPDTVVMVPLHPDTTEPATQPPETESSVPAETEAAYVPGSFEYAVAEKINACRAEAGVEALDFNMSLCGIAAVRAREVSQSWSHTRPDGSDWFTVLSEHDFSYSCAAEELVCTVGYDAEAIVSKWMEAQSNREDLLRSDYTTVGAGIHSVDGTVFLAVLLAG